MCDPVVYTPAVYLELFLTGTTKSNTAFDSGKMCPPPFLGEKNYTAIVRARPAIYFVSFVHAAQKYQVLIAIGL